jgi:hypothetical protein
MNAYFEIAYAAATNRLCLFTGTGFSKAVSGKTAPSWQELLEKLCDLLPTSTQIKEALFPPDGKNPLSLEEAAQVISLELVRVGRDMHEEIAAEIGKIELLGDNSVISEFFNNNSIHVVTTNYDKLAESLASRQSCHSIAPGFPIPRAPAKTKVYHVHGSIDSPSNMVVTSDNYFDFINGESYFSRKLSTILYENTVVILGYSLGDTNLKAIINDYRKFSRTNSTSSNLFLVSRGMVDRHVKDYYAHCYGIRVLDELEVHKFFERVNERIEEARSCADSSIKALNKVLIEGKTYKESYLKVESSFFEIIAAVGALGRSINDKKVVELLDVIIQKKINFTSESGAWEQYEHLARWLCHLATILDLPGTSIERTFLKAVEKSMNTMSKTYQYGLSWHAYTSWRNGWPDIRSANRHMIGVHVKNECYRPEAIELVSR